MKLVSVYRKPISMFVIVSFTILLCFWVNQAPAAPSAAAAEKNSGTTLEQGDSGGPSFIEEESESAAAVKKPHKFPWLIVGAVVVVGAAALYFLVLKSTKYTLTVSLNGATGTPATTEKYKKGTAVTYNYTPQSGYGNMAVTLDGASVASTGTVTMDADHTLTATAVQGATIQVNSTPAGAKIYVNNADSGFTTPHTFTSTTAMTESVLIRMCGYGDYTESVTANLGETKTIDATLAVGIHEDFTVPASSCWKPGTAGSWTTSGGIYRYKGKVKHWDYNFYDHAFSGNYTVTVKMRRYSGIRHNSNGLFLADSKNMTQCSAYVFQYTANGWWGIWLLKKGNMNAATPYQWIRPWKTSTAIKQGLNVWNVLKIVKAGGNYTLYINDIPITSLTGSADMKYAGMTNSADSYNIIVDYDYFYLSSGATAGSIPGLPASPFTSPDENSNGGHAEF